MRMVLVGAAIVGLAVFGITASLHFYLGLDLGTFHDKLRGSFFTGFLTLGGFLLSLKTFIVIKMKEGLYDHPNYRKNYAEKMALLQKPATIFAPLRNLTALLFAAIVSSLLTSLLQVTLGLSSKWWAVGICLAAIGVTLVFLAVALFQIKNNLDEWFKYLDEDATK